jgi:hypothetical protein
MSKIFLFLSLLSLILTKGPYKLDGDVIVLTDKTFGSALLEYKYLIVYSMIQNVPTAKIFYLNIPKSLQN